jgi:hypothetical protein
MPRSIVAFLVFLTSCATVIPLQSGKDVPAAEGAVNVTRGENGNTKLAISVAHLAPPEKVLAGTTTYIVWVRGVVGDQPAQNVGALKVNEDLSGTLDTVTPQTRFQVFITPEANSAASSPSGPTVLSATEAP